MDKSVALTRMHVMLFVSIRSLLFRFVFVVLLLYCPSSFFVENWRRFPGSLLLVSVPLSFLESAWRNARCACIMQTTYACTVCIAARDIFGPSTCVSPLMSDYMAGRAHAQGGAPAAIHNKHAHVSIRVRPAQLTQLPRGRCQHRLEGRCLRICRSHSRICT